MVERRSHLAITFPEQVRKLVARRFLSLLTAPEATKIPEILFSPAIGTYLVVCLDIDAPFASVYDHHISA